MPSARACSPAGVCSPPSPTATAVTPTSAAAPAPRWRSTRRPPPAAGHGGARYVRSGTGAQLAVDAAAAVAGRLTGPGPELGADVARRFATELVGAWRAAVAADLAARPLGAPERSRLAAAPGEDDA